jgi:hypothetical protein
MVVPLFTDWLSLFAALGKATKSIYDWAERVLNQAQDRKLEEAAHMLRAAATLVAALRTMQNSVKTLFGRISLLGPETPVDQRESLRKEVSDFARRDFIIGFVRQSETQLRELLNRGLEEVHRGYIDTLLKCARSTLHAAHDPCHSPFPDVSELQEFLDGIRDADSAKDIDGLKEKAAKAIRAFENQVLVDADGAYTALKADLLRRYPAMPDPGWAVELDELQKSIDH